jgi:hypothetical protein
MTEDDIVRVIDDLKHCDGRHRNIGVYTFDNAIEAIEQLREERDEARREVCEFGSLNSKKTRQYATYRGWDCFKEDRA